ncbi:hypothetical protein DL93DRAFT_2229191 [Clavulina sp. PMI_390]|nr:hypothetical protein DL93DRAFT_2229191 [Clavulina sp. PMI_390]
MDFLNLKSALTELATRADALPHSTNELPDVANNLPHISREPRPRRRNELRKRLIDAGNEASDCLEQISRIEAELALLRRALEHRKAQFSARSAIIYVLPNEILSYIFCLVIELQTHRPKLWRRTNIMLVSQHWHEVSKWDPALWGYQRLTLRYLNELSAIHARFQYAGQYPLRLSICLRNNHPKLIDGDGELFSFLRESLEAGAREYRGCPGWILQLQSLEVRGHERSCATLAAALLKVLGGSLLQAARYPSLLTHVALRSDSDGSCSACNMVGSDKGRLALPDRLNQFTLASLVMSRRIYFSLGLSLHHLRVLSLSHPQNMGWREVKSFLLRTTHLERLTLIRIMPDFRPPGHNEDRLLLPNLSGLVIGTLSCPLLVTMLCDLEIPMLADLEIGFVQLDEEAAVDAMYTFPSEVADALLPLRNCLHRWGNLISLGLRLPASVQPGALRVLLAPFVSDEGAITALFPQLLHLSFSHLSPFSDDTLTASARLRFVNAITIMINERANWAASINARVKTSANGPIEKSHHPPIAFLHSVGIPRCVVDIHESKLRALVPVRQLYCLCGNKNRDEESEAIDPDTGWSFQQEGDEDEDDE